MKRPIKPFVVEVRKGQKKPVAPVSPFPSDQAPEDDLLKRAEAALFGRAGGPQKQAPSAAEPPQRTGRILETIAAPPPEPAALPEEPSRRRGRPPGSKNKPKADTIVESVPKRRGRPPRNPEGEVRRVALTPELANAALETIAKVAVAEAPLFRRMPEPASVSSVPAPIKRPRGRPRKSETARGAPTPGSGALPVALSQAPVFASDGLPRQLRAAFQGALDGDSVLATVGRTRAGERWKRRLRGPARKVFDRRHQKG